MATLDRKHEAGTYVDVQVYTYKAKNVTGRGQVRVAALALGADGGCGSKDRPTSAANGTARIFQYLNRAGELGVDLSVLPENAFGRPGMSANCLHQAEQIDGPLVKSVQKIALQYGMNIVLPFHESRGGKMYNTGVVINRDGKTVGSYSKVYPVFGNSSQTIPPTEHGGIGAEVAAPDSVMPSPSGVKSFELDFGRIGVLICYDINFFEVWHQSEALGVDMLVWPSAMATPDPSTYGYARIFQYDIVAVGYPGDFVGRDGKQLDNIQQDTKLPMMKLAMVDLDRTFVHWDYNSAKIKALLEEVSSVEQMLLALSDILIAPPLHTLFSIRRSCSSSRVLHSICSTRRTITHLSAPYAQKRGSRLIGSTCTGRARA
jgi:hypothetical protein